MSGARYSYGNLSLDAHPLNSTFAIPLAVEAWGGGRPFELTAWGVSFKFAGGVSDYAFDPDIVVKVALSFAPGIDHTTGTSDFYYFHERDPGLASAIPPKPIVSDFITSASSNGTIVEMYRLHVGTNPDFVREYPPGRRPVLRDIFGPELALLVSGAGGLAGSGNCFCEPWIHVARK